MTFETYWVDVLPFLLRKEQPRFLLPRESAHTGPKAWAGQSKVGTLGEFWVTQGNLVDGTAQFSPVTIGEAVQIPVWAYKAQHRALPALFSMGLQIGMAAVAQLRNHTPDSPKQVYLVVGSECTDLLPAEESFRCYLGVAFRTK